MKEKRSTWIRRWGSRIACILLILLCTAAVHAETAPKLTASLNTSETTCKLQWTDYRMPSDGAALMAAVWSTANGQDDLVWRQLSLKNGVYTNSFSVAEHATAGTYNVHLYLRTRAGKMIFLKSKTFTVSKATCSSVSVKNMDVNAGTCTVEIKGVSAPSGVKKVHVPVWSTANQSDIIWYPATKQSDGSWTVKVDFSRHGNHKGIYQIHVYATAANGVFNLVGNTTASYQSDTASETAVLKTTVNGSTISLKAIGVAPPAGVERVSFAVWSDKNGQDDLHWINAKYYVATDAAKTAIDLNDYSEFGTYHFHAYVTDKNGVQTFLAKTTFEVPYPSAEEVDIQVNKGTFKIAVSDIVNVTGIDKVVIPVWGKSDQSDLIWYTAEKQSDGRYVVESDISKHDNYTGVYTAHVYIDDNRGSAGYCGAKTTFSIERRAGTIKTALSDNSSSVDVEINDINVPETYQKLQAAVWTEKNGQDDRKWYDVTEKEDRCTLTIPLENHNKEEGTYCLSLYARQSDGTRLLIKEYTFSVSLVNMVLFDNNTGGTVEARIRFGDGITGTDVCFPTWCASDQSDLVWYQGVKQSDGSYKVTIDVANHKNHSGTYIVHVYYHDSAGTQKFLCGGTVNLRFDADAEATIQSCKITSGNMVTVTADVTAGGRFGLFRLPAGATEITSDNKPLATVDGSGTITLKTDLKYNTSSSLINSRLTVGQLQGDSYVKISDCCYITNPEAAAYITRAFPAAATKKGLQVNTTMTADAKALGVNHSVINVVLNNIPCQSGGIPFNHNGKTWHMDMGYIYSLDEIFSEQAANGSIISAVLLMQWDDEWADLIIESGRTPGHALYGLNAETEAAREQLEAIFCFLADRYSGAKYNVVNWILGNEVDDYTHWNWCGNLGIDEYVTYYTNAFRLLYNSVKSIYSNARVYISFDHVWNYYRSYGFKSFDVFKRFVNLLQAEGDINWNIAYHPYPNPITSPNFWTNRTGATNSINSGFITMINLQYLTDYIKNNYGSQHRFILSESGFTSYINGKTDESLQAAAIAYAYYLAEFNDMVDSFVVHRHVDNTAETSQGLYLGLWNTDPSLVEYPTTKKVSWTVFQKMDTSEGAQYTNYALSIIGADSWNSIVPGYTASRFN